MLENQNFIVFSDDWGRHPSSCQHLFSKIAAKNRVLWVNTIGMRLPKVSSYDFSRILDKLFSCAKRREQREGNIIVYSPFMTPFSNIPIFRKLNKKLLISGIGKCLKKYKMGNPILITTVPNICDVVGYLGEKKAVYYCVDDFTKWHGVMKELMTEMENELLNKVDLILATSENLYANKKSSRCSTFLLSHGVDIDHFKKGSLPETVVPPQIQRIKRPIIGYFGLFDPRLDIELLKYVLRVHPEWSLVILGKSMISGGHFRHYNNIHFLGSVEYELLPNYTRAFDVCMLPYLIDKLTININPLKLREYLAIGKPVVVTKLPEVEKYKNIIKIAENKEQFVKFIESSLIEDSKGDARKRQEAVRAETWENKVEEMSKYLEEILK